MPTPEDYMRLALAQAKIAADLDEVPVGVVVVCDGNVVAETHNLKESKAMATAHAEILAIEEASKKLGAWRLTDCEMYVTLEPCTMCAGAIQGARLKKLFYGAKDPKGGAVDSLYHILNDSRLNHQVLVTSDVLKEECSTLLKDFFKAKRK